MWLGLVLACVLVACGRVGFDVVPDAGTVGPEIPAALCPEIPIGGSAIVRVTTPAELAAAVANAAAFDTIVIAAGTYTLTQPLQMVTPSVTLRSESGNADDVTLDAQGAFAPVVYMRASQTRLISLTIARGSDEGVAIEPRDTGDVLGVVIYDVTFVDNAVSGVHIKPHVMTATGPFADNGEIACSRFVKTKPSTCTDNGGFGIRGTAAQGLLVRHNYFGGKCSPARNRAVWIGGGSRDVRIVSNVFVDNINNIMAGGYGLRTYPDSLPAGCTGTPDFWGGEICNNRIAGLGVPPRTGVDFDEGIALWGACDTRVVHNSIVSPGGSETFSEIEYRFTNAYVHLINNLIGRAPLARDGALLAATSSTTLYPSPTVFIDAAAGDLRLVPDSGIGAGVPITGTMLSVACAMDAEGRTRNLDAPQPGALQQ